MALTAREAAGKYISRSEAVAESSEQQGPRPWGWPATASMPTGWHPRGTPVASPRHPHGIPASSRHALPWTDTTSHRRSLPQRVRLSFMSSGSNLKNGTKSLLCKTQFS